MPDQFVVRAVDADPAQARYYLHNARAVPPWGLMMIIIGIFFSLDRRWNTELSRR